MNYVQRVLQPGEQVRHISSIHWIVYWPGVVVALLAGVAYWLSETRFLTGFWRYTAYALGLIQRETNEMNMDKVESVQIDQSILGRMLDYGDVTILGTGEGFETLRTIASPIELRNSITTGNSSPS